MRKCFKILPIFLLFTTTSVALVKDKIPNPKTLIVKTNLLNIIMIPSFHLEYSLRPKHSLQFNFHRAQLTFLTREDWLNASLDWRYYLAKKKKPFNGFYLSTGLHANHDYNSYFKDSTSQKPISQTNLGVQVKVGFQANFKNSNWYFDFGVGSAFSLINLQNPEDINSPEMRLNISLGYRLF